MFARGVAEMHDMRAPWHGGGGSTPASASGAKSRGTSWFRWGLRWIAHNNKGGGAGGAPAMGSMHGMDQGEGGRAAAGAQAIGGDGHSSGEGCELDLSEEQQDLLYRLSQAARQDQTLPPGSALDMDTAHAKGEEEEEEEAEAAAEDDSCAVLAAPAPSPEASLLAVDEGSVKQGGGPRASRGVAGCDVTPQASAASSKQVQEQDPQGLAQSAPASPALLKTLSDGEAGHVRGGRTRDGRDETRRLAQELFGGRQAAAGHSHARGQVDLVVEVEQLRLTLAVLMSAEADDEWRGAGGSGCGEADGGGRASPYLGLQDIISVALSGIRFSSTQAHDGLLLDCSVEAVRVRDLISANTLHPWLLRSRPRSEKARAGGGGDWYMPAHDSREGDAMARGSASNHSPSCASSENASPGAGAPRPPEARTPAEAGAEGGRNETDKDESGCAVKVRVLVKGEGGAGHGHGQGSNSKACEAKTLVSLTLNPLDLTPAPDSLAALAACFVPSFEYPFHEHLVLDALNGLREGEGQLAAKLAYLVDRSASGRLSPSLCPPLPLLPPLLQKTALQPLPSNTLDLWKSWDATAAARASACLACRIRIERQERCASL